MTAATHADGIPTDQNGSPNALILNPAVLNLITNTETNPRLGTGADIWTIVFTGGGKETEAEKQTVRATMPRATCSQNRMVLRQSALGAYSTGGLHVLAAFPGA